MDKNLVVAPGLRKKDEGGTLVVYSPVSQSRERVGVRGGDGLRALLAAYREPRGIPDDAEGRAKIQRLVDLGILVAVPQSAHDIHSPNLEIELTNRCNADCVMCPREDLRPLGSMSSESIDALADLVPKISGGVVFSGIGEPTLHPLLAEVVRAVRERGDQDLRLVVVTNGSLMTPDRISQLVDSGVDLVQWSLHSSDMAQQDQIMGWSRSSTSLRNLQACVVDFSDHISINCVDVAGSEAVRSVQQFASDILGLPHDRVGVVRQFSRGSFVAVRGAGPSPAEASCYYIRTTMFLGWNGDIYPCSNDIGGAHPVGNIVGQTGDETILAWKRSVAIADPWFSMCSGCDHNRRSEVQTQWAVEARRALLGSSGMAV